jgi:hypothetical protein
MTFAVLVALIWLPFTLSSPQINECSNSNVQEGGT